MATYTVNDPAFAAHDKVLAAGVVDTVVFDRDWPAVEILTDGAAKLYFTVDGSTPTVSGSKCYILPAVLQAVQVVVDTGGGTVVKLISSGTPTYSVTAFRG